MKLRRLSLSNVGPFRGDQQLWFSTDSKEHVTLIGGLNGAGKTTLLECMTIALYGPRAKQSLRARSYRESIALLRTRGVPSDVEAAVALTFTIGEGRHSTEYTVRRAWRWNEAGTFKESIVASKSHSDGTHVPIPPESWPDVIESLLPLSLWNLVFIDGEQIQVLVEDDRSTQLFRSALDALLGLDLIASAERDLRALIMNTSRSLGRDVDIPDIDSAVAKVEGTRAEVMVLEQCLEQESRLLNEARARLSAVEDEMVANGSEYRSAEDLQREIQSLRLKVQQLEEENLQDLTGSAPLLLVTKLVEAVAQAHEASEVDETYSAISEAVERMVIEVVDHAEYLPKDDAVALVRDLRAALGNHEPIQRPAFEVSPVSGIPARQYVMGDLERLRKTVIARLDQLATLQNELRQLEFAQENAMAQNGKEAFLQRLARAAEEVARMQVQFERSEIEVAKLRRREEREISSLRELVTQNAGRDTAEMDAVRTIREAESAINRLGEFRNAVVGHHAERTASSVLSCIKQLLRKTSLVNFVTISKSDARVQFQDRHGREVALATLSAGERQLVALAALIGIAGASPKQLPLILDTPIARLDSDHRQNFVSMLIPASSKQVIVLSTNEEIVGSHYGALSEYVGAEWLLQYEESTDATRVVPGYFS